MVSREDLEMVVNDVIGSLEIYPDRRLAVDFLSYLLTGDRFYVDDLVRYKNDLINRLRQCSGGSEECYRLASLLGIVDEILMFLSSHRIRIEVV